jgi:hypothetical protein
LLRRLDGQGRNVSDKVSSSYAPTVFAAEPEAKSVKANKKAFVEAMARLFAANKIKVVNEGRPSHQTHRIVERDEPANDPANGQPTGSQRQPTGGVADTPHTPQHVGRGQVGVGCAPPPANGKGREELEGKDKDEPEMWT